MSRKSHPIGYKLGVSYLWETPCNLNNYLNTLSRNYFLLNWLLKFCMQNFFYFFSFQYVSENRVLALYSFVFYFNFFLKRQSLSYRKTLFLVSTKFNYRNPRRTHLKRPLILNRFKFRFLFLYYALIHISKKNLLLLKKYKLTHCRHAKKKSELKYRNIISIFFKFNTSISNKKLFKKYFINALNMRRIKIKKATKKKYRLSFKERALKFKQKQQWKKRYKKMNHIQKSRKYDKMVDNSDNMIYSQLEQREKKKKKQHYQIFKLSQLKVIQYKFFILRFKYFLEKILTNNIKKQFIFLIFNLGNISFYKKLNKKHQPKIQSNKFKKPSLFEKTFLVIYNDNKEFSYFKNLSTYVSLFVFGTMYSNPRVLLQWFIYQIIRIKKHSLNTSHKKLIRLFTTMFRNAIHLSALLIGYRFEVIGKVNGSLRTKKLLNFYGFPIKRQCFNSLYDFYNSNVRTYTGVLSLKLWLVK